MFKVGKLQYQRNANEFNIFIHLMSINYVKYEQSWCQQTIRPLRSTDHGVTLAREPHISSNEMIGCDKTPAYQVQFEICSQQTKLNLWYKQKGGIGRSARCVQKQPATLKLMDQKNDNIKGEKISLWNKANLFVICARSQTPWQSLYCQRADGSHKTGLFRCK